MWAAAGAPCRWVTAAQWAQVGPAYLWLAAVVVAVAVVLTSPSVTRIASPSLAAEALPLPSGVAQFSVYR